MVVLFFVEAAKALALVISLAIAATILITLARVARRFRQRMLSTMDVIDEAAE